MHLGDRAFEKKTFSNGERSFQELKKNSSPIQKERFDAVSTALLSLIQSEPEPCFLLSAVLDFIEKIDGFVENYTLASFELWLNQCSGCSIEENLRTRGKIVGKWVDRSDYQVLFPIGMGKMFEGTHFVSAHKSPDLDTTIASFWGWVDAFGARVSKGLHIWNLPGGPPSSHIEIKWAFEDFFGKGIFAYVPKTRITLNLTGKDLMTSSGMVLKKLGDSVGNIDHDRDERTIIVTDDEGFYLGDWRSFDVEQVRHIPIFINSCLRFFENHIQINLITLFARESLTFTVVEKELKNAFLLPMKEADPARELPPKHREDIARFISEALGLTQGFSTSFEALGEALSQLAKTPTVGPQTLLKSIQRLFDRSGTLIEDRPKIFSFLETVIQDLRKELLTIRKRLERLDIAMIMKKDVFGNLPTFVTENSDVTEIREKMGSRVAMAVATTEGDRLFPIGVIQAKDLRKPILGTVSLRDFCNREEMGIPSYLDIISVIDHHKSQLQTTSPPLAIVADAQSSNTLVARQAFELNDLYSLRGQSPKDVVDQLEKEGISSPVLHRLLQKKRVVDRKMDYFIHPEREYIEYLQFLYGILDDTDLLSKVSVLDVECVASLLNRMKSILEEKEVEVISLEDLPRNHDFAKKAAKKILQNIEMYSLYSKVYAHREQEMESHILHATKDEQSFFFADTKVQSTCARVGQSKLFAKNFPFFSKKSLLIQKTWVKRAAEVSLDNPEIDLHIHLVSTIVSAEDVYKGETPVSTHRDEMWIWIPGTEVALQHLKGFLTSFQQSPGCIQNTFEAEFMGDSVRYQPFFKESFTKLPVTVRAGETSFVILRYKAGSINSRKAMISPFLPKV